MNSKPLPRLEIERVFDRLVELAGGRRVDELVKNPSFENADYYFESDRVIAELKTIEKDDVADEQFQAKMQKMVASWVAEGRMEPPPPGNFMLSSKDLPEPLQLEFLNQFRAPLKARIAKANQQIKSTQAAFQMPDFHGLLFLVNDGNPVLKPSVAFNLLHHLLKTGHRSIHHLVYCSVNVPVSLAGTERQGPLWAPASVPNRPPFPSELLDRLDRCWTTTLNEFYGVTFPSVIYSDDEHRFDDLSFLANQEDQREGNFVAPKRFYRSRRLGYKYYCEGVDDGTARMYLVESYQNGKLIQAIFDQKLIWSGEYELLTDQEECSRLAKLVTKMKRG